MNKLYSFRYQHPSPYSAYLNKRVASHEDGHFDILELRSFVRDAIKDVHVLEDCLAGCLVRASMGDVRLSSAITAIRIQLNLAQDFCDAHNSLLTPVHALPIEVMTRIFDLAVDKPFPLTRGPWILTRVCRRWRAIAVAYPLLWTSFTIVSPTIAGAGRPTHEEPNPEVLRAVLAYSHPLPLSFAVSLGTQRTVASSSALTRIEARRHAAEQLAPHPLDDLFLFPDYSRELVKHASRWKSAALSDYAFWLPHISYTPLLEHLCLAQSRRRGWFDLERLRHFRAAPRLRSLVLSGPSLSASPFPASSEAVLERSGAFPWVQLNHLTLVLDATYMAFLILQLCPNLVSFRDLSRSDVWLTTLQYSTIKHRKLQFLHSSNRGILDHLECPDIRHLSTSADNHLLPSIKGFVQRSTAFRETQATLHVTLSLDHDFDEAEMMPYLLCVLSSHVIDQLTFVVPAHCPLHLLYPIVIYISRSLPGLFPRLSTFGVRLSHSKCACAGYKNAHVVQFEEAAALAKSVHELFIRYARSQLGAMCLEVSYGCSSPPDYMPELFSEQDARRPAALKLRLDQPYEGNPSFF